MKKNVYVSVTFFIIMCLFLTRDSKVYIHESESEVDVPCVTQSSSCWGGSARGMYTISANGYGILCSGRGYSDKSKAISHPLEIRSNGYKIVVTLSDDRENEETVTISPESSPQLISCRSGSFHGYLYVIVV